MLLHRLRPATVTQDKETLYEDNLAVRLQLNDLRKENTLLRTKNLQLERELLRLLESSEGKSRLSYLHANSPVTKFKGLRKKVQALNQELISREEENDDMRRDILFTRKAELETQVNVYAEECARLQAHVEELAQDRDNTIRIQQLCEEQERTIQEIEKMNEELRHSLGKMQKEMQKWKRGAMREKRKMTANKVEITNLKAEIRELKGGIRTPVSAPKPKIRPESSPVPKSIQVTQAEIKQELGYEYSVSEIMQRLGVFAHTKGLHLPDLVTEKLALHHEINSELLFLTLRQAGFYWEREEASLLLQHVHHPGDCPVDELVSFFAKQTIKSPQKVEGNGKKAATFPRVQIGEVKDVFRHIAFRLQLQRLPKSKLMSLLIGSNPDRFRALQVSQLQQILSKPPFDVTNDSESHRLARYLIETDSMDSEITQEIIVNMKKSVGDVVEKMSRNLGNWEGFTPEEEENFDQHIGVVLNRNKETFKAACKGYDPHKTEIITFTEFEEVIANLEFDFSVKEKHYLQLLFYSSMQTLDQVPYKELLKAYTEGGQSDSQERIEPSDAELRAMVQKYLQLIANALVTRQIPVREAFRASNGYVSPQQFYEGYTGLQLPPINQQSLGLLVEALQGEEDREDFAIRLSFLEEVFAHYGVGELATPGGSRSSGSFADKLKDQPLSEQSPFLTDAKHSNPPQTSDVKQWDVSESEDQHYDEDDFEGSSARSI